MKLTAIFKVLELINDIQTIGYGSHVVFQNKDKRFYRQVFTAINILCKYGEDMFIINEK